MYHVVLSSFFTTRDLIGFIERSKEVINEKDNKGETGKVFFIEVIFSVLFKILGMFAQERRVLIDHLIKNGADPGLQNKKGNLPSLSSSLEDLSSIVYGMQSYFRL